MLEVSNLSKNYKSFSLDHVSFTVREGRITGFIGDVALTSLREGARAKSSMRFSCIPGCLLCFGRSHTSQLRSHSYVRPYPKYAP